jgi:hypothetical protein
MQAGAWAGAWAGTMQIAALSQRTCNAAMQKVFSTVAETRFHQLLADAVDLVGQARRLTKGCAVMKTTCTISIKVRYHTRT